MKFSKQLRLLCKPEWREQYVDYERLKVYVRNDRPAARPEPSSVIATGGADCCDGGNAPLDADSDRCIVAHLPPSEAASVFLTALRDELVRADSFFHQQLGSVQHMVAQAEATVSDACGPAASSDGVKRAQSAVLDLSTRIGDLREFAALNRKAAEKIAKKFDKRWGTSTSGSGGLSDALHALRMTLCDALNGLSERCIQLSHSLPPPASGAKAGPPAGSSRLLSGPGVPSALRTLAADTLLDPTCTECAPMVEALDVASLPNGTLSFMRVKLGVDPVSEPISAPVMVAKGMHAGPVVGITSAVHGNELNGIPVIHRLFRSLDCSELCGAIVALPVVNVHGYARYSRGYSDGVDLNRIFPGKKAGTASQQFAYSLITRVIKQVDFLLDLHTASFGRVNSLYVRADMNDPMGSRLAKLQNPQIIVHNTGIDGSLRGASVALGKPAVTIEIGNPQTFQSNFIELALQGVQNTLSHLKMLTTDVVAPEREPVVCARSFWLFTETGGVLYVFPPVNTWVRKGDVIAEVHSVFGALVDRILAPCDAIVVGKSTNPVAETGDRIVHLGVVEAAFPKKAEDGHM